MTTDAITPGGRRELRAVVRQQMKVLRTEVKQRQAELVAEAETRLAEKYRDEDKRADELGWKVAQLAGEANRQLEDVLREYEELADGGRWARSYRSRFETPHVYRKSEDRSQLRQALIAGVEAQVRQALLALDRQEANLLRDLAVDALETSAARAFLDRIPTVAELVPSRRLREIEATFDAQTGGTR